MCKFSVETLKRTTDEDDDKDSKVTITEITEEEEAPAEEKVNEGVITQPEDAKSEETVVVEEEKIVKKKSKKDRKVVEQKSEDRVDEEREVVVKTKKTLKMKHHGLKEEITVEETVDKFDSQPEVAAKCVPLQIPQQRAEVVPETNAALTAQPVDEMIDHSIVKIIPRQVATNMITQGEEKEKPVQHKSPTSAKAAMSMDSRESLSIDQPETGEIVSDLRSDTRPDARKAESSLIPSQGVSVSVNQFLQDVTGIDKDEVSTDKAFPSISPLEAHSVTEIETDIKEGEIAPKSTPISKTANEDFVLQESVTVTEVTEASAEDRFGEIVKPNPSHVSVDLPSAESVMVSETYPEVKPEKYYPELIVPTESAQKSIIPQGQTATSDIMQPEEHAKPFSAEKQPAQQTGHLALITDESVVVTETSTGEKESDLVSAKIPETSRVTQSYSTKKSVQIKTVTCEETKEDFKSSPAESTTADVNVTVQESVLTSEVNFAEAEQDIALPEKPDTKTTTDSVPCLETSTVSETIAHELESTFEQEQRPTKIYPVQKVSPSDHIVVVETNPGELPSDFTDTLKYPLEDVSTTFAVLEAKEISDTVVQESEKQFTPEQPTPVSATDESIPQHEISVLQTTVAEKEDVLRIPEFPDSHKGKPSSKTPVHSLVVEEVAPEIVAEDFEKFKISEARAKVDQETLSEMVIEQTVHDEDVNIYDATIPEGKTADFSVLPKESIDIIETVSTDREKEFAGSEKVDKYYAESTITTQKVIVGYEVDVEDSTLPITEEMFDKKTAIPNQETRDSIQVTDMLPSEKEDLLPGLILPDQKTAIVDLTDQNVSVSVFEITSTDREGEVEKETVIEESASFSFFGKTTATKSETLASENITELPVDKPKSGVALPSSEVLEGLEVTETTMSEAEKILPQDKSPLMETAGVKLKEQAEISITEVLPQDKEVIFASPEQPKDKHANLSISGQEIAEKEEIILGVELDRLKPDLFDHGRAHPTQDETPSIISTESIASESETYFQGKPKPEQQTAVLAVKQLRSTLNVTQISPVEQEIPTDDSYSPNVESVESTILLNTPTVVSEMVSNVNAENIDTPAPSIAKAQPDSVALESIVSSQVTPGEREAEFIKDRLPDIKSAESEIIEERSVIVSINVAQDKEGSLPSPEEVPAKTADFNLSGHVIAESTVVVPDSNVQELQRPVCEESKAAVSHLPLHISMHSETLPCELEDQYIAEVKPDTKHADFEISEETSVSVVSETYTSDREAPIATFELPSDKHAEVDISGNAVALSMEVVPQISTSDLIDSAEATSTHAYVKSLPYETAVTIVDTAAEKEGKLEDKPKKNVENALPSFEEEQSVTVLDTVVQETESDFDIEKVQGKTAVLDISGHPVIEQTETIINTDVDKLPESCRTYGSAQPSHIPTDSSIIQTEITAQETEHVFSTTAPSTTFADSSLLEEQSVLVTHVTMGDKETELLPDEAPKTKTIFSNISPSLDAPQTEELILQENTGDVPADENSAALAKPTQQSLHTFAVSEATPGEKEQELPKFFSPYTKRAGVDYEDTSQGLIQTEIIASEMENQNIDRLERDFTNAESTIVVTEAAGTTVVIAANNVTDFEKENIPTVHATSDQIPLTSLVLEETQPEEKEGPFKTKVTPKGADVDVSFQSEKSVSVIETVASEMESELQTHFLMETKTATRDISGHILPEQEEIIPQLSVSDVPVDHTTSSTAVVQQIPQEALQMSEITPQEQEGSVTTITRATGSAETGFVEERGVDILEISTGEKEIDFTAPALPTQKNVFVKLEHVGKEVAEQEQILPNIGVGTLGEFQAPESTAKSDRVPFETFSQSIPAVHETEKPFLEKSVDASTADVTCSEMTSFEISEVVSQDKEDTLPVPVLGVEKTAAAKLSPSHDIPVSSLVIPTDSLGEVLESAPTTAAVSPSQIPLTSVEVSEIKLAENEDVLATDVIPKKKKADVDYEQSTTLTVSEVIPQDKENEFVGKPQPAEFSADVNVTPNQTFDVTEVVPQSSAKSFAAEIPVSAHAIPDSILCQSVESTETTTGEKESELLSRASETKSTAIIEFEEDKSLLITETVSSETETIFKSQELPETKSATSALSAHTIALQKEVIPEDNTSDFDTVPDLQMRAVPQPIPHDSLVSSVTTMIEKEGVFEGEHKPTEKIATTALTDEQHGVDVLQISAIENEEHLSTTQPGDKHASSAFVPQQVPEREEIVCSVETGDVPQLKTVTTTAEEVRSLLEGLVQTQPNVNETETTFTVESKTTSSVAVKYVEQTGVSISEISPIDQEEEFAAKMKMKLEKAETDFALTQLPSQSEVTPQDTIGSLRESAPSASCALPIQPTLNALQTDIMEIVEKEGTAPDFALPGIKIASSALERTNEEVQVQEITLQDKEEELVEGVLPEGKKPGVDLVPRETFSTSEVNAEVDVSPFEEERPEQKTITPSPIANVTSVQAENIPMEQEESFSEVKQVGKKASVSVNRDESINVEVVQPEETSAVLDTEFQPKSRSANLDVIPRDVAESEQITVLVQTKNLQDVKPKTATGESKFDLLQEFVTAETLANEKENPLENFVSEGGKMAEIRLDSEQGVAVTEVLTGEKESSLKDAPKPAQGAAETKITRSKALEISEIVANVETENIDDFKVTDSKAQPHQIPYESVSVSEITPQELESNLTPEKSSTQQALQNIQEQQSIVVTSTWSGDTETALVEEQRPKEQNVNLNVSGLEVASNLQLIPQDMPAEFQTQPAKTATALPLQAPFEGFSGSILMVHEKESKFTRDKTKPSSAGVDVITEDSVSVTVTETADKEGLFTPSLRMVTHSASRTIDENADTVTQSETFIHSTTEELHTTLPDSSIATQTEEITHGVEVTEKLVQEKEDEFLGKFKPTHSTADLKITTKKCSKIVQEIVISDKEGAVADVFMPEMKEARPSFTGAREVAQKTDLVPETNVAEFDNFKPISSTASISHNMLESLELTEVLPQDQEKPLKSSKPAKSEMADVQVSGSVGLSITEVTPAELTKVYQLGDQAPSLVAHPEVIPKDVFETSETFVESSVAKLDQSVPRNEQATLETINLQPLQQDVPLAQESEKPFSGQFKPDKMTANVTFKQDKSLTISEVLTEDKEEHLPEFRAPGVQPHQQEDLSIKEGIAISEIIADSSISELAKSREVAEKAKVQHEALLSVVKQETQTHETEEEFKTPSGVRKSEAEVKIEETSGIIITEIASEDKEEKFVSKSTPSAGKARPEILGQESVEILDVTSAVDVAPLGDEMVNPVQASSSIKPMDSVVVKQEMVQEQTTTFDKEFKPTKSQPSVGVEENKSLTTFEIVVSDKEGILPQPNPTPDASSKVNIEGREVADNLEIVLADEVKPAPVVTSTTDQADSTHVPFLNVVKSFVTSEDKEAELRITKTTRTFSASVQQDSLTAVVHSELQIQETESHFESSPRFTTAEADVNVGEESSVVITELLPQDNEVPLALDYDTKLRSAQPEVTEQISTVIYDVQPHIDTAPMEQARLPASTAILTQDSCSSIIQSELVIQDSESNLETARSVTASANVNVEETESIVVTEVVVPDSESSFSITEERKHMKARKNVLTQDSIEVLDIDSQVDVVELDNQLPPASSIKPTQETHLGLIQTETQVQDSENKLDVRPSSSATAAVNVDENRPLIVTQPVAEEKENKIVKPDEVKHRRAQPDVVSQESVEVSDIRPHTEPTAFEDAVPSTITAIVSQDTLTSLVQSELQVQDSEEVLKTKPTSKVAANVKVKKRRSLIVTQMLSEEKEKVFETPEEETKVAQPEVVPQESLQISDHAPQSDVALFEAATPNEVAAGVNVDGTRPLVVTETVPAEKEEKMKVVADMPLKSAEKVVSGRESIQVSEVKSETDTAPFEDAAPDVSRANVNVTETHSVTVTETAAQEKERTREQETVAKTRKAKRDFIAQESVEVVQVKGVTDALPMEDAIPDRLSASVGVEEARLAVVTETVAQEKEKTLKKPVGVKTKTAKTRIKNQKSVEVLDIKPDVDTVPLERKLPDSSTAVVDVNETSSVIVTEVVADEKESSRKAEDVEDKKAKPEVLGQESLQITDTMVHNDVAPFKDSPANETSAIVNIPESQPLVISETVTQETEKELEKSEKVDKKVARKEVISQKSVEVLDVESSTDVVPFEERPAQKSSADVAVEDNASVIVTETVVEEKEKKIKQPDGVKKVKAKAGVRKRKSVEILDVETVTDVASFESTSPDTSSAGVDVEEIRPMVVTETVPGEKEDQFSQPRGVEEKRATPKIISQKSVQVLDVKPDGNAVPLEGASVTESSAAVNVTETHSVVVTETVTNEIEKPRSDDTTKSEKATPKVIGQESIEILDVTTDVDLVPFEDKPADQTSASMNLQETRGVEITETTPQEKEQSMKKPEKVKERRASRSVRTKKSMQVLDVTSDMDVVPFEDAPGDLSSAKVNVEETASVEITEIIAEEKEKPAKTEETKKRKATKKVISQSSVEVLDTQPSMDAAPFEGKAADRSTAAVNVEEGKPLVVTETVADEKEKSIKESKEIKEQKAKRTVTKKKSIEILDVETNTDVAPLVAEIPDESSADVRLDLSHPVEVTETVPEEKEHDVKRPKEVKEKKASKKVVSKKSVQVLDVTSDMDTVPLEDTKIEESSADVNVQGASPLTISEVVPEEKEQETKIREVVKKKATKKVISQKSVEVLDTQPSIDSVPFEDKPSDEVNADVNIQEGHPVTVTQVVPEEKEEKIKHSKEVKEKKAKRTFTKRKSVEILDVETDTDAAPFETKAPQLSSADVNLEGSRPVVTTETVPGEKETPLDVPTGAEKQTAKPDILSQESVQVTDVKPDQGVTDLQRTPLDKSSAVVSVDETHSIQVTETVPAEQEKPKKSEETREKRAQPKIIGQKSVEITDIKSSVDTVPFDSRVPDESQASVSLQETLSVVVTETIPEEKEKHEKVAKVTKKTAKSTVLRRKSIEILDVTSDLDVVPFEDVTPDTSSADITVDEIRPLEVTETIPEDKEKKIKDTEKVKKKKATRKVISQGSVEVLDVKTGQDTVPFEDQIPDQKLASVTQDTVTSLLQSELQVQDSVETLESKPASCTTANIAIEAKQPVSVCEISSQEKEKTFTSPEKQTESIRPEVIPQESHEVSDTKPIEQIIPFDSKILGKTSAIPSQEPLPSLIQSEFHIQGSVREFEKSEPTTESADINVLENQSMIVRDTVVQETEAPFKVTIHEKKKASRTVKSRQSIEVTEIDSQSPVSPMADKIPATSAAQPSLSPLESVVVTDNLVQQSETSFEQPKQPEKRKPSVNFEEMRNIVISEILPNQKETEFADEKPKFESASKPDISTLEIAQSTEVVTGDVLKPSEMKPVQDDTATVRLIPIERPVHSVTTIQDKESTLKEGKIPDSKMVGVTLETLRKGAETTETLTHDKEGPLKIDSMTEERADFSFIRHKSVVKSETFSDLSIDKLDSDSKPSKRISPFSTERHPSALIGEDIPLDSVVTFTESVTSEDQSPISGKIRKSRVTVVKTLFGKSEGKLFSGSSFLQGRLIFLSLSKILCKFFRNNFSYFSSHYLLKCR